MPASDTYGRFYLHPQLQADGTYKDKVYVEVFIKGNKNTTFSRPMKEEDKYNWPKAWAAFEENSPEMTTGNPLSVLPGIGPSQALNFQAMGILSVEDLAELDDAGIMNINGGRTLQNRAKAWLAALSAETVDDAPDDPVDAEALKNDSSVVKKRGRPRKEAA